MPKPKRVCARNKYKDRDGNEKATWPEIGVIIQKGEKYYLKLHLLPGELFYIFEPREDRDDQQNERPPQTPPPEQSFPDEGEDVPF